MAWIRRTLRGNAVFVRVDDTGTPATDNRGLVDVVYKPRADAKVYRASARNLQPTGDPADEVPRELEGESPGEPAASASGDGSRDAAVRRPVVSRADVDADAIHVWTDGACTGNPGPMGLGALIIDGDKRSELSEYLGRGTNNIAELTAIERALQAIPRSQRKRPIAVHTDSGYSIGVLVKGWKAKANTELIARIRDLVSEFPNLRMVKVPGHAGIPENERCDELARQAITSRAD